MSIGDRTLIGWGRFLAAASVISSVGALVVVLVGDARLLIDDFNLNLLGILGVGFGALVWVTIPHQPRNGAIWVFAASGLFAAVNVISAVSATLLIRRRVPGFSFEDLGDVSASDLSPLEQWAAYPSAWAWPVAFFAALTLGLMLFPDGRAPSRRWIWLGWFNAIAIGLATAAPAWLYRPGSTVPFATPLEALPGAAGAAANFTVYLLPLCALLSVVALVVRYRSSSGMERRQIRWIAWGGTSVVIGLAGSFTAAALIDGNIEGASTVVDDVIFLIGEMLLVGAFALAITKYRLYDVDVVISKTVAYLSLAIVVAVVYVTSVFGLLVLFGDPDEALAELGLEYWFAATALVAIVFEPLRIRLQRLANRMVYGQRSAPHEVLSQLTARLSQASEGESLQGMAQLIREGTAADSAIVWLRIGEGLRPAATYPPSALESTRDVGGVAELPASDKELSVPVRHSGELLGALGIAKPRSHPVSPADEALLSDVAAGAGLLLRNRRLNAELASRAEELRASRRRLISTHDAARHRLERDLHDGAQQQVVALKVRLGLAKTMAEREGASDLAKRVAGLADETQRAVDAMRRVARGIYPPLLEAEGLGPALTAMCRTADLPLRIDLGSLPRYSREAEETIYFCVLEAVTQAARMGATAARLEVESADSYVTVTIAHDSVSDPNDLTALTDRLDAFSGSVTTSTADAGTSIVLSVPAARHVLEPV